MALPGHAEGCDLSHNHGPEGCMDCGCPVATAAPPHGHVTPRPDGLKARCGGPGLCPVCQQEQRDKIVAGLDGPAEVIQEAPPGVIQMLTQSEQAAAHARRLSALQAAHAHVRELTAKDPADRSSREITLSAFQRLELELKVAAFLLGEA